MVSLSIIIIIIIIIITFNDLEWPLIKVMIFFDTEYLRNDTR